MIGRISAFAVLTGVTAALAAPAAGFAQEAAGPNRFQLERTESGFVRLDTQSGALTLCRDDGGQLTCRMAADERAAYEKELDLLEKRVGALERQAASGGSAAAPRAGPPSEEEIETTLSIMERFLRRFMGLVEEFRDAEREPASPERT